MTSESSTDSHTAKEEQKYHLSVDSESSSPLIATSSLRQDVSATQSSPVASPMHPSVPNMMRAVSNPLMQALTLPASQAARASSEQLIQQSINSPRADHLLSSTLVLHDLSPSLLSLHLCQVDHSLLRNIKLRELTRRTWTRSPASSPNVTNMIATFNRRTVWLAFELLSPSIDSKARRALLRLVIDSMQRLEMRRDWFGLFAMQSTLDLTPVQRLLPLLFDSANGDNDESSAIKRSRTRLEELRASILDCSRNYKAYRAALAAVANQCRQRPRVPHLALLLKDCFSIEESQKTFAQPQTQSNTVSPDSTQRNINASKSDVKSQSSSDSRRDRLQTIASVLSVSESKSSNSPDITSSKPPDPALASVAASNARINSAASLDFISRSSGSKLISLFVAFSARLFSSHQFREVPARSNDSQPSRIRSAVSVRVSAH